MKNLPIIAAVLVLVAAAGGFVVGMKYEQGRTKTAFTGNFASFGQRPGRNGPNQNGFRPVSGEILSMDDKSITVKLPDGSSKIVLLTETTVFNKQTAGSKSDLKIGEKVAAFGVQNSDGSVTASDVQINPFVRSATSSGQPVQ